MNKEFRRRFMSGESLFGTFIKSPGPYSIEIMAEAGFDFVIIDAEHAPFGKAAIDHAVLAARASGIAAIVRVPSGDPCQLMAVLDAGAAGVMVPHVKCPETAKNIVAGCRYIGGRGYSNSVRAAGFGTRNMWDLVDEVDSEITIIAMIEDEEALSAVDGILRVDGISGLFIGLADLTVSLNDRTETAARARAAREGILKACASANKPACLLLPRVSEAAALRAQGASVFVISSDQGMMRMGAERELQAFENALNEN